jgi:hypothetical protein
LGFSSHPEKSNRQLDTERSAKRATRPVDFPWTLFAARSRVRPAVFILPTADRAIVSPLGMPELTREQKITFAEMRASGVRGLLIYCSDYRCRRPSAATTGRMKSGCPIWNRGSSVRPAEREGLMSGQILTGTRSRSR